MTTLKHLEDRYEILEKLQEGGQGAIYEVRHRLLHELRLVKVLRPRRAGDSEPRFLSRARATRQGHPNIARIFDCSVDDDGVASIVTERVAGTPLRRLLAATEPPPLALTLEIARQGLSALGHLHKHDAAYRSLSPDDLMLTRDVDGRPLVKLIDHALEDDPAGGAPNERAEVAAGRVRYAAPETLGHQQPDDPSRNAPDLSRSDLYVFALMLYQLLTGRFPISGEGASSLIAGHHFRPPLDFAESDPQGRVPEEVRRAVLKGLAKSPGVRFADAESFAAALPASVEAELSSPEVRRIVESSQDREQPGETATRITPPPTGEDATRIMPPPAGEAATRITPPPAGNRQPGESPEDATRRLTSPGAHDPPPGEGPETVTRRMPGPGAGDPPPGEADSDTAPTRILRPAACGSPAAEEPAGTGEAPTQILRPAPAGGPAAPASSPATGAETRRLSSDQVRAMQADELTARARDHARTEDFAPALEMLREALELAPDHPQATALLASVQACVEAAAKESETQAGVESTTDLLDDPQAMGTLRNEAAAARGIAASQEGTTIIRGPVAESDRDPGVVPAPGGVSPKDAPAGAGDGQPPAAVALDETLRTIRSLRDDGRAGEALKQLNRAVREYGPQPTLRILRDELGEALLEQDAEQEESASQMFEVEPAVDEAPGQPAVAPPGATAPGAAGVLAETPMRGLADATIRSFEPPAEAARERPEPPTAHPTRNMVAVGLILAAVFAALVFVLTRKGPTGERQLKVEDVAAADLSPGSLALDAVPWAEIVGLENPALEEAPPISPSRFTPVVLSLPPGEYWITLRYPPTGQVEERVVRVDSDVRVEQRVIFEDLDAQAYFERAGW